MADPLRTPPGTEDSFVLKCPLDEHDMESVKARNFTIDRCTRCGALWFDMAELQRIIAHGLPADDFDTFAGKEPRRPSAAVHKCPRDGSTLKQVDDPAQPHIHYLQCESCGGMLLRAGSLSDLTHFTFTERLRSFFRM